MDPRHAGVRSGFNLRIDVGCGETARSGAGSKKARPQCDAAADKCIIQTGERRHIVGGWKWREAIASGSAAESCGCGFLRAGVKRDLRPKIGVGVIKQSGAEMEQQRGADGVVEIEAVGVCAISVRDRRSQVRCKSIRVGRIRFRGRNVAGQFHLRTEHLVDLHRRDGGVLEIGIGRDGVVVQTVRAG